MSDKVRDQVRDKVREKVRDIHFALSCFVKAPLEAPAETIGSLINQHGRKQRCSLSPSSLSNEVQIAWNGPESYDPITKELISDSVAEYFKEHTRSGKPRFYVSSKLRYSSSTVASYIYDETVTS